MKPSNLEKMFSQLEKNNLEKYEKEFLGKQATFFQACFKQSFLRVRAFN